MGWRFMRCRGILGGTRSLLKLARQGSAERFKLIDFFLLSIHLLVQGFHQIFLARQLDFNGNESIFGHEWQVLKRVEWSYCLTAALMIFNRAPDPASHH
jgi:hypothetical protein